MREGEEGEGDEGGDRGSWVEGVEVGRGVEFVATWYAGFQKRDLGQSADSGADEGDVSGLKTLPGG